VRYHPVSAVVLTYSREPGKGHSKAGISTGVHEVTVACRGFRRPRKKAENHIIANDYEVALAA
jgi:hypothetical protein